DLNDRLHGSGQVMTIVSQDRRADTYLWLTDRGVGGSAEAMVGTPGQYLFAQAKQHWKLVGLPQFRKDRLRFGNGTRHLDAAALRIARFDELVLSLEHGNALVAIVEPDMLLLDPRIE